MTDWHVPAPEPESTGVAKKWLVVTGFLSFFGGIVFTVVVGLGALFYLGSTGGGLVLAMTVGDGGDIRELPAEVGSCYSGDTDLTGGTIKSVGKVVDCKTEHNLETYFSSTENNGLGQNYDEVDLSTFVDALCVLQYREYVGVSWNDSTNSYVAAMPSEDAWNSGDRRITCVVSSDPSTTTAKGTRS